jgi:hypothetical protein
MTRTLIATAVLAAFAVTGCGSGQSGTGVASVSGGRSSPPSAGASPTATADPEEMRRKHAQCMREHGVPMKDPDANEGDAGVIVEDVDKNTLMKAAEACRDHAPFRERPDFKPEDVDRLRQFAKCMRENGVDMPDPNPDGGFSSGESGGAFKRDDARFEKAMKACSKNLPRMGAPK